MGGDEQRPLMILGGLIEQHLRPTGCRSSASSPPALGQSQSLARAPTARDGHLFGAQLAPSEVNWPPPANWAELASRPIHCSAPFIEIEGQAKDSLDWLSDGQSGR